MQKCGGTRKLIRAQTLYLKKVTTIQKIIAEILALSHQILLRDSLSYLKEPSAIFEQSSFGSRVSHLKGKVSQSSALFAHLKDIKTDPFFLK